MKLATNIKHTCGHCW